jgi:hypothetical protein
MKITIDIPQNASIHQILKAVFHATDYDGFENEELCCSCLKDNLYPDNAQCEGIELENHGCKLAYKREYKCSECPENSTCGWAKEGYEPEQCMTLEKSRKGVEE